MKEQISPDLLIREIQHNSNDYEEMIALRLAVLLEPIGIPPSFINREKEMNDFLIGAFEGDQIIGCCVLTRVSKETLQLRQMAVKKESQGKGVGAAIIVYSEKLAKEKGYRQLMMHARDVVIPFYEKSGYAISGGGFTEVGIAHHMMIKKLA